MSHDEDILGTAGETAPTLDRDEIVEQMGEFGAELFKRLDPQHRTDDKVEVLSVRDFRAEFSAARLPGRGVIVRPQRGGTETEEFLVMALTDVAAALKAASSDFDWTEVFAPRSDLPASTRAMPLHRGRRGRTLAL